MEKNMWAPLKISRSLKIILCPKQGHKSSWIELDMVWVLELVSSPDQAWLGLKPVDWDRKSHGVKIDLKLGLGSRVVDIELHHQSVACMESYRSRSQSKSNQMVDCSGPGSSSVSVVSFSARDGKGRVWGMCLGQLKVKSS
ncbi:hypothetical protein HAX54_002254 [Datura stramonium]|uniref:Uncharacterized protein n=1 Tax=Datura stramonium TaxID=4076 RepID=A0ABS8T3L7_DATST|nr:hypothetical protein [Datura stramonium]